MREFLKGLELDAETIDKIMTEHGKVITSLKKESEGIKEENESYKTEVEKYKNKINQLNSTIEEDKKSLENLKNVTDENNDLKAQIQISGANVKKEFSKFVTSEVKGLVNEETDFNKALETFKKDNPQYFGDTIVKKVQTSPELTGGNTQPQTTNDIMNSILRNAKK